MIGPLLLLMFAVTEEPPRVGRPVDFSGVVGRFRIEAEVTPKSVTVEDPLTLRVTIHGEAVSMPPMRSELRIFPEDVDFFREDVADEDRADPAAGTWTFVWRLRPKSTDVREVPPLRLVYWSPMLRRFQAATTDPVPIEVRPQEAAKPKTVDVPLDVRFLVPLSEPQANFDAGTMLQIILWTVVLLVSTALAAWGSRRQSDRASTAATQVLPLLDRDVDEALLRYLDLRFALHAEPTPGEIDRTLKRRGVSTETRRSWIAWQRGRDARRFGTSSAEAAGDRDEARRLILAAEAESCSRR